MCVISSKSKNIVSFHRDNGSGNYKNIMTNVIQAKQWNGRIGDSEGAAAEVYFNDFFRVDAFL